MQRLNRAFFEQDTITVAKQLIGKRIIFNDHLGIITETEAYVGYLDDLSCHAHGKYSKRTAPFFGKAGTCYVFLIYGIYYCLNIVTELTNKPAAVLIRGIKLTNGQCLNLNGPGKICRFFGINLEYNYFDVTSSKEFYFTESGLNLPYDITTRIGISKAKDKLWRFVVSNKDLKLVI